MGDTSPIEIKISIHAPRGGSDKGLTELIPLQREFQSTLKGGATAGSLPFLSQDVFQSTLPAGGATYVHFWKVGKQNISIHAPRGGSDLRQAFQSTLPAGGAT